MTYVKPSFSLGACGRRRRGRCNGTTLKNWNLSFVYPPGSRVQGPPSTPLDKGEQRADVRDQIAALMAIRAFPDLSAIQIICAIGPKPDNPPHSPSDQV